MAIDKALYQAPMGIDEAAEMEEPLDIEIEIEDPESVELSIDGTPILRMEEGDEDGEDFNANLAEQMFAVALDPVATHASLPLISCHISVDFIIGQILHDHGDINDGFINRLTAAGVMNRYQAKC